MGGGIMGMFGKIMGTNVDAPPDRLLSKETAQMLNEAGPIYENTAEYSPLYTALNLKLLRQGLLGDEKTPGMIQTYRDILPGISDIQRTTGLDTMRNLRDVNPQATRLSDLLAQAGAEDVALGSRLDPEQMAMIRNSVLGRSGNLGWGYSPGDLARVGMETGDAGEARRGQRMQRGQSIDEFLSRYYTQPAMGNNPNAWDNSSGVMGQSKTMTQTPNVLDMLKDYASNLFGMNYTGELSARTATAANNVAMLGQMSSMIGGIM